MAIVVPIVTQYNGKGLQSAVKEISRAEGSFGKLGAAGKIAGASLAGFAAAGAAAFAAFSYDSLKKASDLNETLNKSRVIFGDASKAVEAFAASANTSLGQTKQQAIDAAATFGIFGQAAGLSNDALSTFSTSLVSLSADLASFSNTSPEEAITALGAALRGENEPIRRYGVLLDDAALKAKASAMGIYEGTGALTQQQRVMAAYQLILQQTKNAQGDFSRTADGMANQMRILQATVADTQVAFGAGLAEGLGSAMGATQDLATVMEELRPLIQDLGRYTGEYIGDLVYLIKSLNDARQGVTDFVDSLGPLGDALGFVAEQTKNLWNPVGFLADKLRAVRGETDAAGAAATQMAYDYANAGQIIAGTYGEMNTTYNGGTPTSGYTRQYQDSANRAILAARKLAAASKETASAVRSSGAAADKTSPAFDRLKERVTNLSTALEKQKTKLDEAKQALADYAASKSQWITGAVSLGDAVAAQLDDVVKRADLDKRIAEAIANGDSEGAAKAAAEKAGLGAAVSWTDAFLNQIAQAKGAATAIDELMKTLNPADAVGNKRLLDQLTQLSPADAQMAAQDLVQRGLGPAMAAELSSLDVWANGTALTWAQTFYQPGVDAAQTAYNAIQKTLEAKTGALYSLGKKLGKSFLDGYNSVVQNLPAGVKVPTAGLPMPSGLQSGPSPIVVNVTAGIGNPVAIAREVQAILNSSAVRLGV